MKRITAYVVFAAVYGGLLLLAGFAASQFNSKALGSTVTWVAPLAAAPLALLIAARLERLSNLGIAVTSIILAVCACVATVGIFIAMAVPVVGGPTFEYIARMFASYFTIGGWSCCLAFGLLVAAPLLWATLFLSRRSPAPSAAA